MSAIFLRGLLLAVLVASMAVRFETNRARQEMANEFDTSAAVTAVIRAQGYAILENPVRPPKLLSRVVYFQRPECAQASLVLPYFINEEAVQLLSRVTAPGAEPHFFYIDRDWPEQARAAMMLHWIKHVVLGNFGASRYVPVKMAIALADPPDCRPAQRIDWRPVWERDRVDAVNAARAAGAHAGS